MRTDCSIKNMCASCTSALDKAKYGIDMLKSMTLKSKADIDFSVKSSKKDTDIFSFKKKFDKEYRLLPIIGIILGVLLIMTLLSQSGKDGE